MSDPNDPRNPNRPDDPDRQNVPTTSVRAAETAQRPARPNGRDLQDSRSPAEIRRHIQETRADLDATVDELEQRLKPKRLAWEARRRLEPKVRQLTSEARMRSLRASHEARRKADENKQVLFAALGVVAGLLLVKMFWGRRGKDAFPDEQQGV